MSKDKILSKKRYSETINAKEDKKNSKTEKQKGLIARHSLPLIISSTQRLQSRINEFKNEYGQTIKKLQQSIVNNNMYRSLSAVQIQSKKDAQFLDKKHLKKQKSVAILNRKLQKRIQNDEESQRRLHEMQQKVFWQKKVIQKRLAQIQARNNQKISQIQEFQNKFLGKVKQQMLKNLQKQKRLKKQFQKIKNQTSNINKVKEAQSKLDKQGWKHLMQQKINLQQLMENQKSRQIKLVQNKNPEQYKNQQAKMAMTKQKQQENRSARQKIKMDQKQAGQQYLDLAKKRSSPATKENKKIKTNELNINLKVINYDHQILQKISKNRGGALSSIDKEENSKDSLSKNKTSKPEDSLGKRIVNAKKANRALEQEIIPILQQTNILRNPAYDFPDMKETNQMLALINEKIYKIQEGPHEQNQSMKMQKTIYNSQAFDLNQIL